MAAQGPPQNHEEPPKTPPDPSIGAPQGHGDPSKGNGDPIRGNGDPPKGNRDPINGNGDPHYSNRDPINGNGTPLKGSGDPISSNGDPISGNGDPLKGNGDPHYSNRDPLKGNGDPISGHGDPLKGNRDPISGNGDPHYSNRDPIQGHGDPLKGNRDPIQDSGTPTKGNWDPHYSNRDPLKGNGDISGNGDPHYSNRDPLKGNGDPPKGNGAPIQGNGAPIQSHGTPIQANETPPKGNGAPIQGHGTPSGSNGTPLKGNGNPIQGNGTPPKGNGALIQGHGTPIGSNGTPLKGNGTPIESHGTPIDSHRTPIVSNGAPPRPLGPLRAALEASLLQAPGLPLPPELSPVLGVPLPPPAKCLRLDGARLLRHNLRLDPAGGLPLGLSRLHKALSILEKYGRNLLQPRPPRHWRCVSYSNPVFSSTLGAIQGAREVLMLLGYTAQGGLGLSFPPGVPAPDGPRVAAVTADVLVLRRELELLMANQHPNPQFFTDILKEGDKEDLVTDAMPIMERDGPIGDPPSRCDRPRTPPSSSSLPAPPRDPPPAPMGQEEEGGGGGWACASCTFLNPGPSVLCGVCERPRLARRPPPQGWSCPHCTYFNPGPGPSCALCRQHMGTPPPKAPLEPPKDPPKAPSPPPPPSAEQWRQRRLHQDGRRVVALLRAAERSGSPLPVPPPPSPRALWALAGAAGYRGAQEPGGPLGALSLQEAARAWAWAWALGQPGRALQACVGQRRRQLRALAALGFPDRIPAGRALFQAGGLLGPALAQLQAPRLQPFLHRLWESRTPPMDFEQADQQALVRRALAELGLASWGRAQLFVTLGRELGLGRAPRELPGLVEAVGSCRDREELRRRLRCECAVCGTALPREQAQVLTGCQCWLCPDCFRLHFTVGVRERRVRDLVCPACARPDLRDEASAMAYFSTLDTQLRQCLDPATYELFSQKLTELELERDPSFLWCPQCSFGFIFEGDRGPAQCPQCKESSCPRCLRQWHPRHASMSCADFEAWLSSSDPQVTAAPMGLAAFLQEHSIGCPRCGARFALARGGCLHLQCSQCQHQFCSGCSCPFHPRHSCPIERCPLRASLHGHHPRDCIFHLRDWSPPRLQRLLQDASIPFETEPPPTFPSPPGGGCVVPEQKETPMGLKDEPCGREAPKGYAGLCRGHYTEYLVGLINRHALDPLALYDAEELRAAAERHLAAGRSQRRAGEGGVAYERRLRGLLREEAPLCGGAGRRP